MICEIFSEELSVKINSLGAELISVTNKNNLEFIWQANPSIWARHAPNLFPVVGKLKNDTYFFEDKTYSLGQHGFARDMEFKLKDSTKNSCSFVLNSNEITLEKLPFHFELIIEYYLKENELFTKYNVNNKDTKPIYFSIGAHTAFNIPLNQNEMFEDYFLEFEATVLKQTLLENGLISNQKKEIILNKNKLPLSNTLFDNDALVFQNAQINKARLASTKSSNSILLQSSNWPYFGIWSKKGCREFVCLEPWFGIADNVDSNQNLKEKHGILFLEKESAFECSFAIEFN